MVFPANFFFYRKSQNMTLTSFLVDLSQPCKQILVTIYRRQSVIPGERQKVWLQHL